MADAKISALPAGTTPAGTEVLPAVQSSTTVSFTVSQVAQNFSANALSAAAALTGSESVPVYQTSAMVKATAQNIAQLFSVSALGTGSALTGTELVPVSQGGTVVQTTASAIAALASANAATVPVFNVKTYGALINDKVITDATIAASSTTLTSSSQAAFTSADVGKNVTIQAATAVTAPAITSVTNTGTAGSTTYFYVLTAVGTNGGESTAGTENSTTTANAALSGANFNVITFTSVAGAQFYKLYRGTTSGGENKLIGYVAGAVAGTVLTVNDLQQTPATTASPPGSSTAASNLNTTITAFTSSTQVTIGVAATFAVTAGTASYGSVDTVAFQAAVTAAHNAGGGLVYVPPSMVANGTGAMRITATISWYSNVSLQGSGPSSVIRSYGTAYPTLTPAASSIANQMHDVTMRDFAMDGSWMSDYYHFVSSKGIQFPYTLRFRLLDIVVTGYPATGIATDFGQQNVISGCIANNNGRLGQWINGLQFNGSSGIGIGVAAYAIEDTLVENCICNGNGNNGIFFEWESSVGTYRSTGMRVVNCVTLNNYNAGICDAGCSGMVIQGNYVAGNLGGLTGQGGGGAQILVGPAGQNTATTGGGDSGKIIGNIVVGTGATTGSALSGISFTGYDSSTADNYVVENNRVSACGTYGISTLQSGIVGLTIRDNTCYANGVAGISIHAAGNYITVEGNTCFNNGQNSGAFSGTGPGIHLPAITATGVSVRNNTCYDNQATTTQTYGIQITAGMVWTNVVVQNNNLTGNRTAGMLVGAGTFTNVIIRDNPPYNPVGTASSVTVGSSPFTYTAGNSPEVIYLVGGTNMSATVGGQTIISSSAAITGNTTITLEPNQVLVLTYTLPAPTMIKQIR